MFDRKNIIQTYEPWFIYLSDGSFIKCQIYDGWEYEIETTWERNGKITIQIVYNICNGYNLPKQELENLKKEYEKIIKKEKKKAYQTTIFDFLEEKI